MSLVFSCLSSFHFKWTWTHSNEVKKICDGCLRVWLSVSCLSVQLFLLVCAVVPASDLHPLIHKLPLPKSCLSSWEISPTSCASVFFHPLTLHLLPRPPRLSLTHSYPGLISFFFFSLSLSHTLWSTPHYWDFWRFSLISFFCFLRCLVSLSHECRCWRYPSSSPSTSPLNMCEAARELVSFVYILECVCHCCRCVHVCPHVSTRAVSYCKHKKITGIIGEGSTRLQPSDSNTL